MRVSVFTTVTSPISRGDDISGIESYCNLADELVMVNGGTPFMDFSEYPMNVINWHWPKEFSWDFIGQQFQRGYEAANGDWVIHADLDFIFHEEDYDKIRKAFKDHPNAPALSFWKYQFILPDRYTLKSRLVIAVNKAKFGDRIRFDGGGDLCQPTLDGVDLSPDEMPEARVPFYNYEKLLKTEAQIKDDVGRMARAWHSFFGAYKLGGPDDEDAYAEWLQMTVGRFCGRSHAHIPLSSHPEVMKKTLINLRPDQWGYSGFGHLVVNEYAKAYNLTNEG